MATPVSRATSASFAVDRPGISSERSKSASSSRWQKYCVRKSSGRHTICAPSVAASRTCLIADEKFASGSAPMRICASAIVYLRAAIIFCESSLHRGRLAEMQQGQPRWTELASISRSHCFDRFAPPRPQHWSRSTPHAVPTLRGSAPRRRWWWSTCRACRRLPTG